MLFAFMSLLRLHTTKRGMSSTIIPQMLPIACLLISLWASQVDSSRCKAPDTINYNLRQLYCDQPIFANIFPKSEETQMMDNICFTYFPLPDDPTTFTVYESVVFCDGSNYVKTLIATEAGIGKGVYANPSETFNVFTLGYAGCDTYIALVCQELGPPQTMILSLSTQCRPLGLSCLRSVREILSDRGLPDQDLYVMPMKLPHRCVMQQLCTAPPNPFYNKLPTVALY